MPLDEAAHAAHGLLQHLVLRGVADADVARAELAERRARHHGDALLHQQPFRRREDKVVCLDHIRARQLTDVVEVPLIDRDARKMKLPASERLRREVVQREISSELDRLIYLFFLCGVEMAKSRLPMPMRPCDLYRKPTQEDAEE